MAQRTRHGLYGGPRQTYGSFAGKSTVAPILPGDVTISRQGPGAVTLSRAGPIALPVQTTGAISPSSVENDDTLGVRSWSNLNNALSQDDTYATAGFDTYYLAFAFDLSPLPSEALIDGIVVEADVHNTSNRSLDVRLKSGGAYVGDTKSTGALPSSDSDNYVELGGTEDTWSAGLAASDLKASDFRVGFRDPAEVAFGGINNFDHPRMTIYYHTLSIAAGATTVSRSGPGAVTVGRKTS